MNSLAHIFVIWPQAWLGISNLWPLRQSLPHSAPRTFLPSEIESLPEDSDFNFLILVFDFLSLLYFSKEQFPRALFGSCLEKRIPSWSYNKEIGHPVLEPKGCVPLRGKTGNITPLSSCWRREASELEEKRNVGFRGSWCSSCWHRQVWQQQEVLDPKWLDWKLITG